MLIKKKFQIGYLWFLVIGVVFLILTQFCQTNFSSEQKDTLSWSPNTPHRSYIDLSGDWLFKSIVEKEWHEITIPSFLGKEGNFHFKTANMNITPTITVNTKGIIYKFIDLMDEMKIF